MENHVELGIGFKELRAEIEERKEDKRIKDVGEERRRDYPVIQLPPISGW